ncbi:MAG: Ig-like domain-containing protein [Clostridia bacterium]|nr:Ig-like domain-containing protein [Clostridia bacterium]
MNRLRQIISSLLIVAVLLSPASAFAAEGPFILPSNITEIESEAFSGVDFSNGVFIPQSCLTIASDAFSNPSALDIYGFFGSAAESYANQSGAVFHPIDIKNASVSGPTWASPDRPVSFTADFDCEESASIRFEISKAGSIVYESPASVEKTLSYSFKDDGEYEVAAIIQNAFEKVRCALSAPVVVAERIKTNEAVFYLSVGESANLISSEETRAVSLSASNSGLSVSGTTVTAKALGKYTVTAKAETAQGTVYTDIPVEVIVPATSVSIQSPQSHMLDNHSIQLTAKVLPEDATYKTVKWSVSDHSIASISETGLLTGHKKGAVTVYAASGDVVGSLEIRVDTGVTSFEITSQDMPQIPYTGMRFTLSAKAIPENADNPTCSFVSLTPEIASVDAFTGVVTCLKAGEARIQAAANDLGGGAGEFTFTVQQGVTDISFALKPGVIHVGETFHLEASALPENAKDKTLSFASSNEKIVTVSESGLITAKNPGTATVSVRAVNGYTVRLSITVPTPVSSVSCVLSDLYLNPGMTLSPIGNFVFIKPENATDSALTWSSDNNSVAAINKNTGLITAVSDGVCEIKGVSHNGKSVSFTLHVVSDKPVIKKFSINHTYGALNVGNVAVLEPKADVNNEFTSGAWYSDHPEILDITNVDASGKATVKALSAGTATIYAVSSSGISATCTIVVNPIVVTSMYLNASSISLNVADTFPLAAVIYPETATANRITWTSSDEEVAVCDENGLVRALSGGLATITASTEDGVSASCRVTVNTILMTNAWMNEAEISVLAGGTGYPSYTVEPKNATPAAFSWASSDKNVVSVSSSTGKMTYLKAGKAVVSGTALDGSGLKISLTVNVREIPVTSISANTEKINLLPGEEFEIHTRVLPVGASFATPVFTSKDETIASVSEEGRVKAVSIGTTEITVSVGRGDYVKTLSISVTVEPINDITYRALIMSQFTVPATDGYLPFSSNSTKGFTDAISRSSIDGNRYQVNRLIGSPTPGAIRSAISRLADQADENDVTVIFFLTHGTNSGSEGYQMQTNSGITIEPMDMIDNLKAISGNVIFVLCTCHSGRILSTAGAKTLKSAGGSYEGRNGRGYLSILCSSTSTISSYYRINDEKLSYDFYTYALTRGLGWDMLNDYSISAALADSNGDGKVTVSELASYTRGATQRAISSFVQQNGTADFSGHTAQFPTWQIADGHKDLVIFQK